MSETLEIARFGIGATGSDWGAHSVAHTEVIRQGVVWEEDVIYRAIEGNPDLFQIIYVDVLAKRKNAGVGDGPGRDRRVS